jgi:hypothetical protein
MSVGWACRLRFDTLDGFAACIAALNSTEAIALGALRDELPERVEVTTKDRLAALNETAQPNIIARTSNHIFYRPDQPALALIDFDTKGIPPAVRVRMDQVGGFTPALISVLPGLAAAGRVVRPSTSAGITRLDTGQEMAGSNGVHLFVLVQNGADVERFLKTLHARCWLHGFGWMMVGAGGQLLERSIVDRTVAGPERLVFEAPPIMEPPLEQNQRKRTPILVHDRSLDTWVACPDLTVVEKARLRELHAAEKNRLHPEAETARTAFVNQQAAPIVKHSGRTFSAAQRIVERQWLVSFCLRCFCTSMRQNTTVLLLATCWPIRIVSLAPHWRTRSKAPRMAAARRRSCSGQTARCGSTALPTAAQHTS